GTPPIIDAGELEFAERQQSHEARIRFRSIVITPARAQVLIGNSVINVGIQRMREPKGTAPNGVSTALIRIIEIGVKVDRLNSPGKLVSICGRSKDRLWVIVNPRIR